MGRVFATGDWHGCGIVGTKVLNYLQPDDRLYYIGDAIDRGPHGGYLLNKLLSDPRVIFIKGNHEEFFQDYMPKLLDSQDDPRDWDLDLWYSNGGRSTVQDFINHPEYDVKWCLHKVRQLSYEEKYNSPKGHQVILEHSGYTPGIQHRGHDPLWDREHFQDEWNTLYNNVYLVHGHTPVQYLKFRYGYINMPPLTKEEVEHQYDWYENRDYYTPHIIRYCGGGHKFNIDMCTIVSGRIALLDLDTFEEVYFDE